MEEHAQFNSRRISKADFLKAISSPYRRAFTPENVKKSFEKTGTWPIDRTKITSDMVGPSVGLSGKSAPIVVLNSPLKRVVELLENYSINSPQSQLSTTQSQCPSPASQTSSLPNDSAPAPSPTSSISNLSGFEDTRATFLFDGSPPSSSNAIPPFDFHPPSSPVLSDASSKRLDAAKMTTMTKSALIAQIQNLEKDIGLLIDYSQEMKELVYPLNAQAALLGLENKSLRAGLSLREKKRISSRERLFPGGTGSLATGDAFMDEQASIDREKEQTKAKKSTAQAELAARKELWTRAKVEWEERRQALVAAGRFKGEAGNPPLLRDIQLNNSTIPSAPLSSAAQTVQNSQKGKGRQRRLSIDSLIGEEIDLGDLESDEGSEAWSVHDESDG